ncbi:MAG: Crp/Fnr family transcriptional regulator [Flavobacteriales bacterium]|nr:Crp/Fnr family transcriptional regulator [Flavobacteriales bacterium]
MSICIGNCVGCSKVNHSLFDELNDDELKILNYNRTKFFFKKGDYLYKENEQIKGLICLNDGKVKLVKKGNIEEEFIVGFHKPVDFIGFDDLMYNGITSSYAIALEDVSACIIRKEQFFKVIVNNPNLSLKIISHQSRKSIQYQDKFLNVAQQNLESRLAYSLNQIVEFFGFETDEKTIAVSLKRKEIAAISNMNTANVIRCLSNLKKKKIIDTNGRKIIILNYSLLKQLFN